MKFGLWQSGSEKGLSKREMEATVLAANDLSVKEIAREMGTSPNTVQGQLNNARFKLGMQKTLRGLCMEAIRRGVIIPLSVLMCVMLAAGSMQADNRTQLQRSVRLVRTVRQEGIYAGV